MLRTEGEKIRVLLIEDSVSEAVITEDSILLADDGRMEIFTAVNLASGMNFLDGKDVDVILLDLNLPDSDGKSSISKISESYPKIPIIVLSGTKDEDAIRQCLKSGIENFLSKDQVSGHGNTIRHAIFDAMFYHSLKKGHAS